MASLKYSIVDVFSSTAYKGNPLAVVNNTTDALTTPQMQLLARQFNLSETTFVCPPTEPPATWKLRSFLPNGVEVFGAGHNSLGAWWWIAHSRLYSSNPDPTPYQQLGDTVLPVQITQSTAGTTLVSLRQGPLHVLNEHPDPGALAAALGLAVKELQLRVSLGNGVVTVDRARVVTTSAARHLVVPVCDREALRRVSFGDSRAIAEELARMGSQGSGVYVFTGVGVSDDGVARLEARFFSPGMAMEDPATGSAAGPLVAYLWGLANEVQQGRCSGRVEVVQGLEVGRECVMVVDVDGEDGVRVSGTGVLVAEGDIVVPAEGIGFP